MTLVEQLVQIKRAYGFTSDVLAASIRRYSHVVECAMAGTDIATMPFKVLTQLTQHPLTDSGLQAFLKDWATIPAEIKPF